MAAKEISMLSLIVVIVISLIIYIAILKLMWDWQQRTSQKDATSDQFLTILATTALIGILTFINYIVLVSPKKSGQFDAWLLSALALEVMVASYVSYFHHDLRTESGYLLMILLVLFATLTVKLSHVNKYASVAAFFGGVVTLFLHLKVMGQVKP